MTKIKSYNNNDKDERKKVNNSKHNILGFFLDSG